MTLKELFKKLNEKTEIGIIVRTIKGNIFFLREAKDWTKYVIQDINDNYPQVWDWEVISIDIEFDALIIKVQEE